MAIISISGKMGAGKDLVGSIIQYLIYKKRVESEEISSLHISFKDIEISKDLGEVLSNYKIVKFADKLKDVICLLIGCTREQLEDRDFKEKELGEEWWYYTNGNKIFPYTTYDKKVSKLELIISTPRTLLQKIGTDLFRNQLHPQVWVNATMADYKDMYNWIITDCRFPNEADAVRERGGVNIRINRPGIDYNNHTSETALDDYQFDYVIDNTGTVDELTEKVRQILIKINVI